MTGGPATDWQDELRSWFAGRPAEHEFTGHAMAWQDGAPIFSHVGGFAHRGFGVAIDQHTRFATASVTKMATAIAALRLVDRGLLGLNAPLVDVLPPEHRPAALTREHMLHHLLSHTSGLANYHDDDDPTLTSWLANWDRIPTYHARRPADLLPLFIDLPADAPPGREVRYNDGAFVLAGLVIEAATGRPWDEVVAEEVFEPAGMTDTTLEAVDADPPRLAVGYMTERGHAGPTQTNVFSITANPMPDGGMISTPADLCRLIDELEAGRLLSAELTAAMARPQGPPSDEIEQWGYGCQLTMRDGDVLAIGHGGSDPGVSALVSHYRAAGTTVVVLCNADRGAFATTLRIAAALGIDDPRRAWLPA